MLRKKLTITESDDFSLIGGDIYLNLFLTVFALLCIFIPYLVPPRSADTESQSGMQMESREILEADIAVLEDQIAERMAQLKVIETQFEQLMPVIATRAQTEQAVSRKLVELEKKEQQQKERLGQIDKSMKSAEELLSEQKDRLDEAGAKLVEEDVKLVSIRSELKRVTRHTAYASKTLKRIEQKIEEERKALHRAPSRITPVSEERLQPVSKPTPVKEGFTLSFASTTVFYQMVKTSRISVFVTIGSHFWKFEPDGSFTKKSPLDGKIIYDIPVSSLDRNLVRRFSRQTGVLGAASQRWLVILPQTTNEAIRRIRLIRKGGDLFVQADGSVKVK